MAEKPRAEAPRGRFGPEGRAEGELAEDANPVPGGLAGASVPATEGTSGVPGGDAVCTDCGRAFARQPALDWHRAHEHAED